jgi:redox-sensitive bicupin YhaK (pirin superfamily)
LYYQIIEVMDRKKFIKQSLLGAAGIASSNNILRASNVKVKHSTYDKLMEQVGFNHLPNKELRSMKSIIHRASTRGHANHGWLDSHHTFSFANYRNPERMHFGVLRVLNDDAVAAGRGFGTHPHDNMEIISIPLEGDLEHKDSMGNVAVIKQGDVQVMSAGTGIYHSEYNKNAEQEVKFLQIWLFPNKRNVTPRYDQISLKTQEIRNTFYQILSPHKDDEGVWIHQNAWFHMGEFDAGKEINYNLKDASNGVYAFIVEGEVKIEGEHLYRRDGFGVWDTDCLKIISQTKSKVLLMEVPMQLS